MLRISDYPYVLRLVELGMRRPACVFAAVDHAGADITLHQGDIVRSESVDGGGYPVHKPVTAGWSGYGDFQRTTEEAVRMKVRAVADRLTELVDETGAGRGVRVRRGPLAHRCGFGIAGPRGVAGVAVARRSTRRPHR